MRMRFAAMETSCGWWSRPDYARMDLSLEVNFSTLLHESLRHLLHALLQGLFLVVSVALCVLPHVLCDFHRAEVRAAHGTEMGGFGALRGQGLVVEFAGGVG